MNTIEELENLINADNLDSYSIYDQIKPYLSKQSIDFIDTLQDEPGNLNQVSYYHTIKCGDDLLPKNKDLKFFAYCIDLLIKEKRIEAFGLTEPTFIKLLNNKGALIFFPYSHYSVGHLRSTFDIEEIRASYNKVVREQQTKIK